MIRFTKQNNCLVKRLVLLVVINFISLVIFSQANPFASKFSAVDKYIDSTLKEWNVPGLAMSVVYKDKVIYSKGYGYRDLEKIISVDANTIFPIASNTKLFTSTIAAVLHHENKLSLDKPVKNYLPSLVFSTDELNAKITIRDMLSHRSGLPRYDGIWDYSSFTRKELVDKISYMKPQLGFREGYIYNNMMFLASGLAMEQVTNRSWETLIREKIFQPLQMNASCFTQEEMEKSGNFSRSYFLPDSTTKLLPKTYLAISPALGPAGTIKSSANEMANWMIAQLNGGKFKGQQVIVEKAIAETLIPNNISDKLGRYDELSNSIYCLGRNIYSYKGHKVASHGGAIDGFYSFVTLFTKDNIGIFVVVNANHGRPLSNFVPLDVFDRLMNLSITPWSQRYMKVYKEALLQEKRSADSVKATKVKNTSPSHALKDYTGTYTHSAYGDIKIELDNGRLLFVYRGPKLLLHHFHYDQFATNEKGNDFPDFSLNFLINTKGEIDRINMIPGGDPKAEFVRKKD